MSGIPYIILAIGSLGLSTVFGYWIWNWLQSRRFRADLLALRVRVQKQAAALGCLRDVEYRQFADFTDHLIEHPTLVSWSRFLAYWLAEIAVPESPKTDNPQLRVVLDDAQRELGARIAGRLIFETATGLIITAIVSLGLPSPLRQKAEKKIRRPVQQYVSELNGYHPWPSCA
jgi:hypothetical protein